MCVLHINGREISPFEWNDLEDSTFYMVIVRSFHTRAFPWNLIDKYTNLLFLHQETPDIFEEIPTALFAKEANESFGWNLSISV